MKRLCFALDHGRPCNRQVMKPLGMCDQHREAPQRKPSKGPSAEYQRERRARLAQAGVMPGFEVCG